ncbi:PKD domain-containing protein [Heliomarina baculiformis]|uniref:PKD domain-containing protein n=1 Tax=Heliomarina baculiformis TaxID=2872036 RepID=UPI001EE1E592|nr:PKD domain-containing protein [Heliomarina baculiformis]
MNYVLETDNVGVNIEDIALSGDFTIEFNVYFEPGSEIAKNDGIVSSNIDGGNDINFFGGIPRLYDANWGDVVVGTSALNTGEWNHIAFVREGGVVRLYVNGVNDANSTTTNYTDVFNISTLATSVAGALEGRLDEVRIWSLARPGAEVLANADGALNLSGGVPVGLERYYRFDDDIGHIVDATGNAETGHDLHPPTGTSIIQDDTVFDTPVGDVGGFIDTKVVTGLVLPTDLAFLPDGRALVIQKSGEVLLIEDPSVANSTKTLYMDLSAQVENSREAGLLNVVVDPNFDDNGYFYLLYTNLDEQRTTVSRFQHQENAGGSTSTGDISSETVLWREFDTYSEKDHQGGGLAVAYEPIDANDPSPYKLYITVGEEFEGENAADLTHDDGKVHRINLTDGSIPTDNPYYDPVVAATYTPWINTQTAISTSAANTAIDPEGVLTTVYSYGLRNPFRAEYDQDSGTLWIGEVGGNGRYASEDVHIAYPGANMGWPSEEGYLSDPDDPGNPVHSYIHASAPGQDQLPSYGDSGSSISGGVVYRGSDFPEEFQGAYFYGDWVRNWIRYLEVDYSSGEPVVVSDNHFKNATGQVLTFAEAPDGTLYYITTFQTGNIFNFEGAVNRLEYSSTNTAPGGTGIILDPGEEASLTAPHTVTFETDAFDPDGDAITYEWSFGDGPDIDGDGIGDGATSTDMNPTYTYTSEGQYTVELIVTDANGAQTVYNPKVITVGEAPVVTINAPTQGQTFRAGETITFTGSAFDANDGVLTGEDVFWSVNLAHNEHFHPEVSAVENTPGGFSFVVPTDGHDYYENVGYQVSLTAIDSSGLRTTKSVTIFPEESNTTYDMPEVSGFNFYIDGIGYSGDQVRDNIIGFEHTVSVQASYIDAGFLWEFSHWEDDPSLTSTSRQFIVPETDSVLRPVYAQTDVVGPVNAEDDTFARDLASLNGNQIQTIGNVLLNDDNPTGDPFSVVGLNGYKITGAPKTDDTIDSSNKFGWIWGDQGGQFRVNADGTVEFRDRDLQFAGLTAGQSITTSISYLIADGDDMDEASLSLTITGAGTGNTAPTGAGILLDPGEDSSVSAPHTVTFESDVTDAEGHTLSYFWDFGDGTTSTLAAPEHTYGSIGFYNVSLTVTDELGAETVFNELSIDVGNAPPVAVADSFALPVGFDPMANQLNILDNDYDPDGSLNMQVVEIVSGPSFGTVEILDTAQELADRGLPAGQYGQAEYTAFDPNFEGTDSFTYRVQDNEGTWSNIVTAEIVVQNAPVLTLDAVDDGYSVLVADIASGSWVQISGNVFDNDTSDGALNLLQLDGFKPFDVPDSTTSFDSQGRLKIRADNGGFFRIGSDGSIEFKDRDFDFTGLGSSESATTTIGYTIGDGTDTDAAFISLTINGSGNVNTAPSGAGILLDPGEDSSASAPHTVTFESDVTDAEGHTLSYFWDFGDGTTSTLAAPEHTYGSIGFYNVSLTVTDELGAETVFNEVSIDVGNAPPVAVADSFTLPVGFDPVANHLHILDNDYDPDGSLNMQLVEIVSGPSFGTVEIMDTAQELADRGLPAGHYGHAEYATFDPNFEGTDSFTYRVQDNEGTWSNIVTAEINVQSAPSNPGGALASVNSGSGLDIQDISVAGDFTVEFWIALNPGTNTNKYDSAFAGGVYDDTPGDDPSTDGVFGNDFNFHAGLARLYSTEIVSGGDAIVANTALTSNGVANHVALVREGNDFSIYMNGVLDSTSTLALDGDLLIERLATNVRATKALSGTLDEFRVWDDARSASEIANYMNQEVASNAEDLLRYYQFDDDTFVIDSTGNAETAGDLSYASVAGVDWIEFSDWFGA